MRVALGSTSSAKRKIVEEVLNKFDLKHDLETIDVSSEITDQPLDEDVTTEGSVNRAKKSLEKAKKVDFAIGLEGGLEEVAGKGFFLVCVATICDKDKNVYIGVSSKLQLPREVSEGVKQGKQFGELIRQYASEHNKDMNVMMVVDELISRNKSFHEALTNAYLTYSNNKHFV